MISMPLKCSGTDHNMSGKHGDSVRTWFNFSKILTIDKGCVFQKRVIE